jgi:anti-anti-sigma regulatory factor
MAENETSQSTDYDPLAWMNDDSEQVESTREISHEKKDMKNESSDKPDSKITLDATLNIQNVGNLYERLLNCLESQDKIEIDASAVNSIDTATLQVIIVLKQTAIQFQKEVIIDFPSDKFIEAAGLLGLSEMLEVDQVAAGLF